jgi:capsular exopolysaccharide synthesis family protein
MSRIFDALQRSERERSGSDSATLPEGPELLKHAESHAVSEWNDATETNVASRNGANGNNLLREAVAAMGESPAAPQASVSKTGPAEERRKILNQLKPLPVSLSEQSRLVCLTDKESATAEAMRLLAVRLRDIRRTTPLKKILITSTIPQEGKSMIAGNLACALAHASDERILLVEGDLRRPSLARMFGIDGVPGICECLRTEGGPVKNIYRLEEAGLWILPAGKTPSNPLGLLQSQRLPALMDQLVGYFDWMIIDSPPVLPLADTSIWMRMADGIFLVTRIGTTEKHQLEKGLEALPAAKMLGALVNSSVESAYSGYYYRSPRHSG